MWFDTTSPQTEEAEVTASQLIKALKRLDPDLYITISSDPEGNAFWSIAEVSEDGVVWPSHEVDSDLEEDD